MQRVENYINPNKGEKSDNLTELTKLINYKLAESPHDMCIICHDTAKSREKESGESIKEVSTKSETINSTKLENANGTMNENSTGTTDTYCTGTTVVDLDLYAL